MLRTWNPVAAAGRNAMDVFLVALARNVAWSARSRRLHVSLGARAQASQAQEFPARRFANCYYRARVDVLDRRHCGDRRPAGCALRESPIEMDAPIKSMEFR